MVRSLAKRIENLTTEQITLLEQAIRNCATREATNVSEDQSHHISQENNTVSEQINIME